MGLYCVTYRLNQSMGGLMFSFPFYSCLRMQGGKANIFLPFAAATLVLTNTVRGETTSI